MYSERTLGKIDDTTVFPAIAIPVENKREFECPVDHLKQLRMFLPHVTKIIIVGWRATETHFLDLLKSDLTKEVQVQAILGGKQDAEVKRREA